MKAIGSNLGHLLKYSWILKYGFCNKVFSERWNSDQLNTFTTYLSSLFGVIAEYNSNHAQKWGQICSKCVQLVRVSFFWSDFLQNPYFNSILKSSLLYQKFDHCIVEKSGLHQPLLKTFLVSKLANLCDNFRQKHSICIQFSKHHGACLLAAAARTI